MAELRFSDHDLDRFARASHDRNPLHASSEYARRTPFGRRVVFGVLSVLGAIGAAPARPGLRVRKIVADFLGPVFTDVAYDVEWTEQEAKTTLHVLDGGRRLVKIGLTFERGAVEDDPHARGPVDLRREAVDGVPEPGAAWSGAYWPIGLDEILPPPALRERGLSPAHVAAMLAS